MVLLYHLLHVDGGLHAVVHGRMREDGFVVEQVALGVEADHLTAGAEAGVDAHDALLAQGCRQQQLAQVLGEDANGLVVGLLLAEVGKLGLDGGFEQALVTVLDSLGHESSAGCVTIDIMAAEALHALVVVNGVDAQAQDALGLAAAHGQQAVAGAALQGLVPVEIVAVLLGLVRVLLGLDHLRGDDGRAAEGATHLLARAFVLADHLGNDVLSPTESGFGRGDGIATNKTLSGSLGVALTLLEQDLGQRLQALLAGHLGTGAALGAERQVDVLQLGGIPRLVDALLQLGRQLVLLADGLQDGLLAAGQLAQLVELLADGGYLHFVEAAGALLAVAGNEGNGAPLLEQCQRAGDAVLRNAEALGYEFCKYFLFHSGGKDTNFSADCVLFLPKTFGF